LGKQEKVPRRAGARARIQYNRACKALQTSTAKIKTPIADEIRSYNGTIKNSTSPSGETCNSNCDNIKTPIHNHKKTRLLAGFLNFPG
jgi:hypothetical protein